MVQLGVVCSRTIDGKTAEFGTSGYTKDNTFVLYDRVTDSIWWPRSGTSFDAVAGKKKATTLPFLAKPTPIRLGDWAVKHPATLVLLGEPPPEHRVQETVRGEKKGTPEHWAPVLGTWKMSTAFGGRQIPATMTLTLAEGRILGTWKSMGGTMHLRKIELLGKTLKFERSMGEGGPAMPFTGDVEGDAIEGSYSFDGQKLECNGTRTKT